MLMGGTADFGSISQTFVFIFKINPLDIANIDPSFGNGGVAKIGGGTSLEFGDMLVQSDGKIVVISTDKPTTDPAREVQIIRLKSDGELDLSAFGTAGRTNINFMLSGDLDFGISGAFQNGRIIVGGHSLNTAPQNYDLTVARLSNDLIFADNFD